MDSPIAGHERVIARQHRLPVAAGEVHGADVAGGNIAISVPGRDREAVASAGGRRRGEAGDGERVGSRGVHRDAYLRPCDRGLAGVRGGQGLAGGRLERRAERVHAVVAADEGIGGGQAGVLVGAAELDRTQVSGNRVAIGICRGHGKGVGHAGHGRRRVAGDCQLAHGRGSHRDARLRAADGGQDRVRRRQELTAGRLEGR